MIILETLNFSVSNKQLNIHSLHSDNYSVLNGRRKEFEKIKYKVLPDDLLGILGINKLE